MLFQTKETIEKISKGQIKIGIEAPKEVVVAREEVANRELVGRVQEER